MEQNGAKRHTMQRLGDTQTENQRPSWHHTFQNLNWVASYFGEVRLGTRELGDLVGSSEGDDVGGLLHVPINTWAREDVGVGATIAQVCRCKRGDEGAHPWQCIHLGLAPRAWRHSLLVFSKPVCRVIHAGAVHGDQFSMPRGV